MFDLNGKVAIVTGANQGLGFAMCQGLAKAGADIFNIGRREDDHVIREAVAGGINKINVCTDAFHAAEDAMKAAWEENPGLNYMQIMMVAEQAIKKFVKDYIRVIGSNNQYVYGETVTVGNE